MNSNFLVIIPTVGRSSTLARTLESIASADLPDTFGSVVVVENGRKGTGEDVCKQIRNRLKVDYLHVATPGKNKAINQALAKFPNSIALLTDDDVRVGENTIRVYDKLARKSGPGSYFGGPTGVDYDSAPPSWLKQYLPRSALGWQPNQEDPRLIAGRFLGFNWVVFASDILNLGGFNTSIGPGSQFGCSVGDEDEMQRRMIKARIKPIFVPEAMIWHYVPPERCSEQWMLDRAYREGFSQGVQLSRNFKEIFGCPVWLLRRCATLYSQVAIGYLMKPSQRFRYTIALQTTKGSLAGFRCGYHLQNFEPESPIKSSA